MAPHRLSLLLLALAMLLCAASPAGAAVLFSDSLAEPVEGNLVTNEYAHWSSGGVESPDWDMTSGSLFAGGWTGVPDDCGPNRLSTNCTNSAVFRLNTKRFDFGDVRVDALLRGNAWTSTGSTPEVGFDGIHLWLRYQDEESLYYASVARRDGKVLVKKKCRGGSSNGGTYYEIGSSAVIPLPLGEWRAMGASIDTAADGSVVVEVFRDGVRVLRAVDAGEGCAPITAPGAVGVRGDNLDFHVRDFRISELHPAAARPPAGHAPAPPPAGTPAPAPGGGDGSQAVPPPASVALRPVSRRFRRALRLRVSTGSRVSKVRFSLRGRRIGTDSRGPFTLRHTPTRKLRRGVHTLRAVGYDRRGRRVASDAVRVRYLGRRLRVRPASHRFRRALRVNVRASSRIERVRFSLRGRRIRSDRREPFRIRHRPSRSLDRGVHKLRVTGFDRRGRRVAGRSLRVRYLGGGR
ncbi:MAG: hypothetical protein WD844_09560 [Thermoleophilaceae bacterium]